MVSGFEDIILMKLVCSVHYLQSRLDVGCPWRERKVVCSAQLFTDCYSKALGQSIDKTKEQFHYAIISIKV